MEVPAIAGRLFDLFKNSVCGMKE
jgi:hypothetical protein